VAVSNFQRAAAGRNKGALAFLTWISANKVVDNALKEIENEELIDELKRLVRLSAEEDVPGSSQVVAAIIVGEEHPRDYDRFCVPFIKDYCVEEAYRGNSSAQLFCGKILCRGLQDIDSFIEPGSYFKMAADQGIDEAKLFYADFLLHTAALSTREHSKRESTVIFLREAISIFRPLSDKRNKIASFKLGQIFRNYYYNKLLKDDPDSLSPEMSEVYIRNSAVCGYPEAQLEYVNIVSKKLRPRIHDDSSIDFSQKELLKAEECLSSLLSFTRDDSSGELWFKDLHCLANRTTFQDICCQQEFSGHFDLLVGLQRIRFELLEQKFQTIEWPVEDLENLYELLRFYRYGILDDGLRIKVKNPSKLVEILEQIPTTKAKYMLAEIYFHGESGIQVDKSLAFEHYREALDLNGSPNEICAAASMCASMLSSGDGIGKDENQADAFLQLAADLGDADSQYRFGCSSLKRKQDVSTALHYFELAAELGHNADA
jgi:tetratricopeptide (TPR) repeat protein